MPAVMGSSPIIHPKVFRLEEMKRIQTIKCVGCQRTFLLNPARCGLCFQCEVDSNSCKYPGGMCVSSGKYCMQYKGVGTGAFICEIHAPLYFREEWQGWKLIGMRVLDVKDDRIVWLRVTEGRYQVASGQWVKKWDVEGSTGETYVVALKTDGSFGCSCPGWKFKKAPKPDCKHIRAMKGTVTVDAGVTRRVVPNTQFYRPVSLAYDLRRIAQERIVILERTKTEVDGESFFVSGRKFRD